MLSVFRCLLLLATACHVASCGSDLMLPARQRPAGICRPMQPHIRRSAAPRPMQVRWRWRARLCGGWCSCWAS